MALAVSTVVAGIGAAVGVAGLGYSVYNSEKAASANASAAKTQGQIAQLQAQNVDVQQQELALQTQQNVLQINTNKSVIQQQQAADDIRQQSATLDATRRMRQSIRTGIIASGGALTSTVNAGAGDPGSTAFKQSQANIQGQTNTNIQGVEQNYQLGTEIYGINKSISQTYLAAQDQNASYVQKSQALQDQALATQKQIYSLGGSASNSYAEAAVANGNASIGSAIMGAGVGVANNANKIGSVTQYLLSGSTWGGTPSPGSYGSNG